MKKKDFTLAVKRFVNLWYCYDPHELKEKLAQLTSLALTLNEGIFEIDSNARAGFVFLTNKLPLLVDALYLSNLDLDCKEDEKREILKTTKLTAKQIESPILLVFDFFEAFSIDFTRIHLALWLEALVDLQIDAKKPLGKNEIFPFFLFMHEFVEVSYLMLKFLKYLDKEDKKNKKRPY